MKNKLVIIVISVISLFILGFSSMGNIRTAKADGKIYWDGNGSGNLPCYYGGHWNFTPSEGVESATLYVDGTPYEMRQHGNGALWADSSGIILETSIVFVDYIGEGNPQLQVVLSHCLTDPSTSTPTPTATLTPVASTSTPTSTDTDIPKSTPTYQKPRTPVGTPVRRPTDTPTPQKITNTPKPRTPVGTPVRRPTDTPTPQKPTNTPTIFKTPVGTPILKPTGTPTKYVPIFTPTSTGTPYMMPLPSSTPKPPYPAFDDNESDYPSNRIAILYANGTNYDIYSGVNSPDGFLLLPSKNKGGALYDNQIWIHRVWNTGWFKLKLGESVAIGFPDRVVYYYKVIGSDVYPYGKYIYGEPSRFYVITCHGGADGDWDGVEAFELEKIGESLLSK